MVLLEGAISVKAAILAGKREVVEVIVDEKKHDKDFNYILAKAYERKIKVTKTSREKIDELASGKTHGGLIAYCQERKLDKLSIDPHGHHFFAIVEGIEDPFNFGYACRTLYAAGCDGLLIHNRWEGADSTILKSSAGASEYINLIEVEDFASVLQKLKKQGFEVYSAMRKDAIEYYDADFRKNFILAIGGEKRGLSKDVLNNTTQNIYISYANDFKNALNASSAVAAIAFEVVRQRRSAK